MAAALLHAFHSEYGDDCPGGDGDARRLARLLAVPTTVVLLAHDGSEPVGLAVLFLRDTTWTDAKAGLLEELYVVPARRDQGIGTALMAALTREVADEGVSELEIPVDEGDTDTRRFYERLGFRSENDGERSLYYARSIGE